MEKIKLIMMSVSTVFVIIAGAASAWMATALPDGDPNVTFFTLAAVVCFVAALWFGVNVWNLRKQK